MRTRVLSDRELLALTEEMAVLARAGLPLPLGLQTLAADWPKNLRSVSQDVAARLEHGESLATAFQALVDTGRLPRAWCAVVAAGARGGHLEDTLDQMASAARNMLDMRRALRLALIYPVLTLVFSYISLLFFFGFVTPQLAETFTNLLPNPPRMLIVQAQISEYILWWGPLIPLVFAGILIFGGYVPMWRSNNGGDALGLPRGVPGLRGLLQSSRAARLAELLGLALHQKIPLPDALELIGPALGMPGWENAFVRAAENIRQGQPVTQVLRDIPNFPPLVRWVLTQPSSFDKAATLRKISASYYQRAYRQAEDLRDWLPVAVLCAAGLIALSVYVFLLVMPMVQLFLEIAAGLGR